LSPPKDEKIITISVLTILAVNGRTSSLAYIPTHIMSKLICVVGATGNQGGSVARRFHKAGFRVRALCRNPESPAALKLKEDAPGIEVVAVDLNDVSTLIPAFKGANVIFSVTQYWEPFMRPDYREKAREQGITCRRIAYDVEYLHGKNIVDAAATTLDTLESFLASTLSHAGKASGGKITELYHFDAKADIFPTYVEEKYPELAAKLSCIHTGYFYTSYNILPSAYFSKVSPVTSLSLSLSFFFFLFSFSSFLLSFTTS
jgi:hypothetical protein